MGKLVATLFWLAALELHPVPVAAQLRGARAPQSILEVLGIQQVSAAEARAHRRSERRRERSLARALVRARVSPTVASEALVVARAGSFGARTAGDPGEQPASMRAMRSLMALPGAELVQLLVTILRFATPAGRLYALAGLSSVDKSAFDVESQLLRGSAESVDLVLIDYGSQLHVHRITLAAIHDEDWWDWLSAQLYER